MSRPLKRVLIANRGEIAARIAKACHELGLHAIAVASTADRDALHTRCADEVYEIGDAPPQASYLNHAAILDAARRAGADAIHPGYGFLAENAAFAEAVAAAGLVWIGPPPAAIRLMGDKLAAKRAVAAAGVPTVPGYDDRAPDLAALAAAAARVGFPLLVKAAAGGGGKGMRVVERPDDLGPALEAAQREAQAAFGDGTLFLERYLSPARHVEVQVLADAHGNVVHLGERECSIQRRHQKIVEEAPSPALTPALRAAMGAAAVAAARAAGYVNAGTVEFLLDAEGSFYFLEMNTRLQVEHPVTEAITGLDLVHLQLAIAAGEPLPFRQEDVAWRGHAIECRLYAEDPARGFLPATGRLAVFAPPHGAGLRLDTGVSAGDEVHVHYDPMLAKLIAHGATRAEALARLRWALDRFAVLGVTTNLPFLRALVAHPAFAAGETTTDFLARHELARASAPPPWPALAAVALAELGPAGRAEAPWHALGPWRQAGATVALRYRVGPTEHTVTLRRTGQDERWSGTVDDAPFAVRLVRRPDSALVLDDGQRRHVCYAARHGEGWEVWHAGEVYRARPADPLAVAAHAGADQEVRLTAPMPGKIVKVWCREGERVAAGQRILALEAMKMEFTIAAPHAALIRRLPYGEGDVVPADTVLVELDEHSASEGA
jgi:3-methylcrotonyl-CoA carboxylase alpha subunit